MMLVTNPQVMRDRTDRRQIDLFQTGARLAHSAPVGDVCEDRVTVAQLADLVGDEAACKLVRDIGGTRVYVPLEPGEAHPLVLSVGMEKARLIGARFGGDNIELPMHKSRAQRRRDRVVILDLHRRNRSAPAIARAVGCSERTVYRVIGEEG